MTTEKLIELAKYCIGQNPNNHISCKDCPYKKCEPCQEMMLSEVLKRLEMVYIELLEKAYTDLKSDHNCCHCKYHDICEHNGDDVPTCTNGNMWEWAGDSE